MGEYSIQTSILSADSLCDSYNSSVAPLYQTATFKFNSPKDSEQEYSYSRFKNPTRTFLQEQIKKLYKVDSGHVFAVSSGMAALDIILKSILNNNDGVPTIIAGYDLYGGTHQLLTFLERQNYAHVASTDTSDTNRVIETYKNQKKVTCVILESPTNPLMNVVDIPKIAKFIKDQNDGCKIVVDNTMMSGLNCNPLEFGVDVVYESGTKYLNGHHDIVAGILIAGTPELAAQFKYLITYTGVALSPSDSWLLTRGLKTLSVRLYKQQYNAMVLAHWLEESCGFKKVGDNTTLRTRFVGLKSHPQHQLHRSFNSGPGAVLSIETGDYNLSKKITWSNSLNLWETAFSFGCVNSLISMPCEMSHASMDPKVRKERSFPEDLIRFCCGIEDIEDIKSDLLSAFEQAGVLVLKDNGNTILNKLNGHIGTNSIKKSIQTNIYNDFFGTKD